MPNVLAALPNIRGALFSTPQIWLMPTTKVPCSNADKPKNIMACPIPYGGHNYYTPTDRPADDVDSSVPAIALWFRRCSDHPYSEFPCNSHFSRNIWRLNFTVLSCYYSFVKLSPYPSLQF